MNMGGLHRLSVVETEGCWVMGEAVALEWWMFLGTL